MLLSSSFSHGARAQHQALTVVIVEQQVQEALAYAIRALGLEGGSVVRPASAPELSNDTGTSERLVGMAVHQKEPS